MTNACEQTVLLGDQGRRRVVIDWGVEHPAIAGVSPAGVDPAADHQHAVAMAASYGPGARVVRRERVTYTGRWTPEAGPDARSDRSSR